MKKVKKFYSRSFSVFNITKEDLEYIEGVLMKLQPEDYKIEIKGYELNSINEFKSISNEPKIDSIKFGFYRPEYVSIDISIGTARLYTADGDNIAVKGAFREIESRLSGVYKNLLRLAGGVATYIGSILLIATVGIIGINEIKGDNYSKDKAVVIVLTTSAILVIGLILRVTYKFRLNPYDKAPGFFRRNKDGIIVGVGISILGVVLTLIGTSIFLK